MPKKWLTRESDLNITENIMLEYSSWSHIVIFEIICYS